MTYDQYLLPSKFYSSARQRSALEAEIELSEART